MTKFTQSVQFIKGSHRSQMDVRKKVHERTESSSDSSDDICGH